MTDDDIDSETVCRQESCRIVGIHPAHDQDFRFRGRGRPIQNSKKPRRTKIRRTKAGLLMKFAPKLIRMTEDQVSIVECPGCCGTGKLVDRECPYCLGTKEISLPMWHTLKGTR